MAKVDTIKLTLSDQEYSYNINVRKDGIFRLHLNANVAELLGVNSKIESKDLNTVRKTINDAVNRFKAAKTVDSLHIHISYKSCGAFNRDADGSGLHSRYSNPKHRAFEISSFGAGDCENLLGLDFEVYLKREIDGRDVWFKARKGNPNSPFRNKGEDPEDPNKFYPDRQVYSLSGKILIPYSEEALETLAKARDGIRKISEMLFNVVSQESETVQAILESGKLKQLNQ